MTSYEANTACFYTSKAVAITFVQVLILMGLYFHGFHETFLSMKNTKFHIHHSIVIGLCHENMKPQNCLSFPNHAQNFKLSKLTIFMVANYCNVFMCL